MTGDTVSSTHPLLPPTTEDDRVSWLRLLRSRRVGIATFYRLMGEHGSAQAALEALPAIAAEAGVENYETCPEGVVLAELRRGREAGAQLIFRGDPTYPAPLTELPDPPPMLWAVGDLSVLQRPAVALVGSRNASALGTRMARSLAKGLAREGWIVVSGLARGIDAAAHHASLETGTIGVLAGGVDVLYPAENAAMAEEIPKHGLRLSEQPMGMQPMARHFPARNRIVSGLARAVIVVEAAAKSGSLITARNALDLGREVMAVPGHPFDNRAAGCNMLLRDGARLVRGPQDVIEALPELAPQLDQPALPLPEPDAPDALPEIPRAAPERRSLQDTAALHSLILDRLSTAPITEDELIRAVGASARLTCPAVVELEIAGKVQRHPGSLISRLP
ncbi:DNA-processing protein DprA [Mesobacterium pallidum]|uniref:DNA-processing protein DprA n=1 Tax=Mesobacterium pallidum TaxID=2872037 RepID=UPI001EE24817|nr:DNA-processing protein DprA [Mesobacterium pallidum]